MGRKAGLFLVIGLVIVLGFGAFALVNNDETEDTNNNEETMDTSADINQTAPPQAGDKVATITTSKGDITVRLFEEQTPETVKNFIFHAEEGNYKNVPFHRVIDDFMIQTGDFENQNGTGGYSYKGPGTSFADEFNPNLSNIQGALSMANAGPGTNGSQFFIVEADDGATFLDGRHSVFGQVTQGLDIVQAIAEVQTNGSDRPLEEIVIKDVTIETA